jgi:murein DD-endopeptidase MepM/ murein hydrolase activator NlpD
MYVTLQRLNLKPMKILNIKHLITGLCFCAASFSNAAAQDMIAKQAPIDDKLREADSVAIMLMFEEEDAIDDFYKNWDTQNTHCYNRADVPDSLVIDLKGFCMPTKSRKVTSNFGYRRRFRRMHKGIDVKVYTGDTIYAAFDGKVRIVKYERKGYGKYVVLRHNNGLETIYDHMSKHLCNTDDEVKAGQPIGLGGNTGRSYGSHLHFETRVMGEAIDPAFLFDFPNQDVTGDFYTFHKPKTSKNFTGQLAKGDIKDNDNRFYKVKKGDNLSRIASKTGTSVTQLCKMNRIKTNTVLRLGQILRY